MNISREGGKKKKQKHKQNRNQNNAHVPVAAISAAPLHVGLGPLCKPLSCPISSGCSAEAAPGRARGCGAEWRQEGLMPRAPVGFWGPLWVGRRVAVALGRDSPMAGSRYRSVPLPLHGQRWGWERFRPFCFRISHVIVGKTVNPVSASCTCVLFRKLNLEFYFIFFPLPS